MPSLKILTKAVEIAAQSEHKQFRHGAVLFRNSRILNCSSNQIRYTKFARRFVSGLDFANVHAEIGAILNQSRENLVGSDILVVRTNKSGEFANSKPCPMCASAMKHVGIRRVWFSNENGEIVCEKL